MLGIAIRSLVLLHRTVYPLHEEGLKRAEEEARAIIMSARSRAQSLGVKAEQDGAALLASREKEATQFAARHEQTLKELVEHHAKLLEHYSTLAHDAYREFDASVKKASSAGQVAVKQEIERLLVDLREEHKDLRKHFVQQFKERLSQELLAVREVTDAYREAQLRMIDRRIVALVERVAALTLQKELSVSEHADMVYKSLEEAKKEGVI
ncbi:MAG TPA: hypothetical protein VGA06_01565 [Candidatus Paceibacterota bacterium]